VAISLLLPVVSTMAPVLLDRAISMIMRGARLHVFFGGVGCGVAEQRFQHLFEGLHGRAIDTSS
jgi:uncharacterized membrane protein